jgi:hypothetical protein
MEIAGKRWYKKLLAFSNVTGSAAFLATGSAGWPETILGQHRLEYGKVIARPHAESFPQQPVFQ